MLTLLIQRALCHGITGMRFRSCAFRSLLSATRQVDALLQR